MSEESNDEDPSAGEEGKVPARCRPLCAAAAAAASDDEAEELLFSPGPPVEYNDELMLGRRCQPRERQRRLCECLEIRMGVCVRMRMRVCWLCRDAGAGRIPRLSL